MEILKISKFVILINDWFFLWVMGVGDTCLSLYKHSLKYFATSWRYDPTHFQHFFLKVGSNFTKFRAPVLAFFLQILVNWSYSEIQKKGFTRGECKSDVE